MHTHPDAPHRLALLGTLLATFGEMHPFCDNWCQTERDAICKGMRGDHLVYADGKPVDEKTDDRTGHPTMTATTLGRRSVARHVASYTAVQVATAAAAARALGYRVPLKALAAGALINGGTHLVIDRREPLRRLAHLARKDGYIEYCTAVRKADDKEADESGPGTALYELDQSLHRAIGVAAAVVMTWVATRQPRR